MVWLGKRFKHKGIFFICLNPHVFDICLSYNTINDDVIDGGGCDISIWIFELLFPSMPLEYSMCMKSICKT